MKLQLSIQETFKTLVQTKKENDQQSFNRAMQVILQSISNYISIWLSRAEKNMEIPSGKYKVEDFVDELYIQAYDYFQEVGRSSNLYAWLFKKTNELLEDTEIEEEFDDFFFKNIDKYSDAEWQEMEEKYTSDGSGDPIMEEELDDLSYSKNDYVLEDVFIEDGEKLIIENLNKKLKEEQIHRHINFVMHHLPVLERTVFDLVVKQAFNIEEVAKIKQISIEQVKKYLKTSRNLLGVSLKSRYTI